jgi:hypothetical protein
MSYVMVNVSRDFPDYDDDDPNIERRTNRWKFFEALKELSEVYKKEHSEIWRTEEFVDWINDLYGIKINMNATGITDEYIITDEKKYIVFKLKYG